MPLGYIPPYRSSQNTHLPSDSRFIGYIPKYVPKYVPTLQPVREERPSDSSFWDDRNVEPLAMTGIFVTMLGILLCVIGATTGNLACGLIGVGFTAIGIAGAPRHKRNHM